MIENFVTVFDRLYLPQGIALHISMERVITNYALWILCVDDETYDALVKLELPNVRLLSLKVHETPELKNIKPSRSKGEYCWTLSPFAPRFVFEADKSIERVTYIDADLWFRKPPDLIFEEFEASKKHVLITDHAYSPDCDQSPVSGEFCVQFMCFTRIGGELVRKWWEERCVEWCFNRFEDGKLGDQRYLDNWPKQFQKLVHVLQNKELALAPWNATRFPFGGSVFYHFHGLRIVSETSVRTGGYSLPTPVLQYIYEPYLSDLNKAIEKIISIGMKINPQIKSIGIIEKTYMTLSKIRKAIRAHLCYEMTLK
jgi:hypothetical protein